MNEHFAPRPWYRLHAVTWLAMFVVAESLLLVNLVGYYPTGGSGFVRLRHGWPVLFATREIDRRRGAATNGRFFELEDVAAWSAPRLAAAVLLGLVILGGTAWMIERWRRRWTVGFRMRLSATLASIGWIECCVVLFHHRLSGMNWENAYILLSEVGAAVFCVGMLLAWLALFDVTGVAWKRVADGQRKEI
jgi:hypothetical protein